jgi:hypothetical protein
VRVVNVGKVSPPRRDASDPSAGAALLVADAQGYRIALHPIEADHEAVLAAIRHSRRPGPEFLTHAARRGRPPDPVAAAAASVSPEQHRLA